MSNEVTASNSQAVLISEYAKVLNHLRMLIAVCKQVAHAMPTAERCQLLDVAMRAEGDIK